MPSLATLLTYLGQISGETQEILARHQTQLAKYNNVSSLTTDEKQNILEASDEPFIDDLVAIQRDQLAVQVLQKMLLTSSQEVDSSLCKFFFHSFFVYFSLPFPPKTGFFAR